MRAPTIVESELQHFERALARFERGELDLDVFKRLRLQYGVYSLRQSADRHMLRVRVPLGRITADQLEALAQICERWTQPQAAHVTTRQDVQLYGIERPQLPAVLRALAAAGLTTREASGNVIRNVVCCPWAGVSPEEPFDVTPFAEAVCDYFLRNPLTQLLPRKVKIAFEGCATDHARTAIHDIGVVAARHGQRAGVRIYLGGGLGPLPKSGGLLEPWTGPDMLLPTIEAVLRVFDRTGNRSNRARARIKFLIEQVGWDVFRAQVLETRQAVWATQSGASLAIAEQLAAPAAEAAPGEAAPADLPVVSAGEAGASSLRWQATNVAPQRQSGAVSVLIRVPSGDLTPSHLRGVAQLARRAAGSLRLTNTQNVLLRSVPSSAVRAVHEALGAMGLAEAGAGRLVDVTRCPGADSCLSAVTRPRGLAEALEQLCHNGLFALADLPVSVKISGCPNSCGQHHIGDIGCFGVAVKVGGRPVPCYQLLLGGSTREGQAVFGKRFVRVPARHAPDAISRLVTAYHRDRKPEESFDAFVHRVGQEALSHLVADLTEVTAFSPASVFMDLGATEPFQLSISQGECGA